MGIVDFSSESLWAFKRHLETRGSPNLRFRLGVRGGGCSGFSYDISWCAGEDREGDVSWDVPDEHGQRPLRFVVDVRSAELLRGTRVGWKKTLVWEGFTFDNPNAGPSCGCGQSFSPKPPGANG